MGRRGANHQSQKSIWEEVFARQVKEYTLPAAIRQYSFARCVGRQYKADFAWVDERLIVEVQGGLFNGGRHARGAGVESDLERQAIASCLGWKLMGFSPRHVKSGWAVEMTAVALGAKEMERELASAKRWPNG